MVLIAILVSLLASSQVASAQLPSLPCPTFATEALAEANCPGTFLFWGEFVDGTSTLSKFEETQPSAGGYSCSTCGVGYVCDSCPTAHSLRLFDDNIQDCPDIRADPTGLTCSALQQACEEGGFGWLVYGETFASELGYYACAGCNSGFVYGTEPSEGLLSAPIIMLYVVIVVLAISSTIIDAQLYLYGEVSLKAHKNAVEDRPDFDGDGRANTVKEWRSRFILTALGFLDREGNQNPFWSQVCSRYCCYCNGQKRNTFFWAYTLSVLLLSLGVSILLKGGKKFDVECGFQTFRDTIADDLLTVEQAYTQAFSTIGFGKDFTRGVPGLDIFSLTFILGELIIIATQFSLNLLIRSLDEAELVQQGRSVFYMLLLSAAFAAGSAGLEWNDLSSDALFETWAASFFVVLIIVGPFFGLCSFLLASALLRCNFVVMPPSAGSMKQLQHVSPEL